MRISVVIDCQDIGRQTEFWTTALDYELQNDLGHFQVLLPKEGSRPGPVLILQEVPEDKECKNRLHLDLHPDDPAAHIALLEGLGAKRDGERVDEFGVWWQVLNDPEGNEFCIVADAEAPPGF